MTESKTQKAAMPMYRLTRADYPRLQSCRRLARLEKLKSREYTGEDGQPNISITYSKGGKTLEAQNLDEWATALSEAIAVKIEQWTPAETVVTLTEMLAAMRFCDPNVEVDLTKLKSGRIDKKLAGIVTIADNSGFGLNRAGEIVELAELLRAITQAEKLGMKF